jgi:hypothetical protein
MTLIGSWKDSLRVLTPQGLKELGIATWNTIKEVCTILYAKWFIIVAAVFCIVALILRSFEAVEVFGNLLIPLIFLAALPVFQVKNFQYFVKYLGKYSWGLLKLIMLILVSIIVIALILLIGIILTGFLGKISTLLTANSYNSVASFWEGITGVLFGALVSVLVLVLLVGSVHLVMLFYFTREIPIRAAIKKSLKFMCYNFPLMAIYFLIQLGIGTGIEFIGGKASLFLSIIFAWFITCLGITLYIKRINANPALYQ